VKLNLKKRLETIEKKVRKKTKPYLPIPTAFIDKFACLMTLSDTAAG